MLPRWVPALVLLPQGLAFAFAPQPLRHSRPIPRNAVGPVRAGCRMPMPERAWHGRVSGLPVMQLLDDKSSSFYDEFKRSDVETGDQEQFSFAEKEKLYLECLDAYYNENGKTLIPDDEFDTLKEDLNFEGSVISALSKEEIQFVLANKRYRMGKPVLEDAQYDELRKRLKAMGSPVVLHEAPSCSLDTGICKSDLSIDQGKTRLLYLPGTVGANILLCEALFWTMHLDPLLSIVFTSVPSYFFGKYFTENIFAQKPLVTSAPCPSCSSLVTTYFGDLFNVGTDIIKVTPGAEREVKCPVCGERLLANRDDMVIRSTVPKI